MDVAKYVVSQSRLSNGLCVVHVETALQRAACTVFVRIGSRDEAPREQGLVHLLEHMLFKGTAKRRAYHISSRLERVGGELNASTSKEDMMLQATVLPQDLERSMELEADIVLNASFPEHELEREREVVLEEIASYGDSVFETLFDQGEVLLYGDHPLGHPILGTPELVGQFTREQLLALKQRYFVASNMALCTVGPLSAKRVFDKAERYFGAVATGGTLPMRLPARFDVPRCQWENRQTVQTHCLLLGQAFAEGNPNLDCFYLLMNILAGDAATSRLNMLLREKHGFVYALESDVASFSDSGYFSIYFGTDKGHVARALSMVLAELRAMAAAPISDSKLRAAKRQYLGQLALNRISPEALAVDNARRATRGQPLITQEQMAAAIQAFSADDLQRVADTVFKEENFYTLIYR